MRLTGRLLLATGLVAVVGLGAWWLTRPEPVAVRVAAVERGTVEEVVANTRAGTVMACRRARLAPGTGGQIATLSVHEGDRVEAGQLLLELWNQDLKAGVTLAEREADAAEARARAACLNADQAEREAARQVKLQERRMASEEALDRAITAAQAGRADCEAARATARVSAARVGVAQAELERTRLTAPFAGIVAEVSGELNEYVTPSPPGIPTPPAVDLIDDACFYISAPIDEVDAAAIRLGQPARVALDAFGDRTFDGTVRRIAPYVLDQEKQARTVEVEVVITAPPADTPLLAGYSADVEIVIDVADDALHVPTAAIRPGDPPRVLLLDAADGRLLEREIATGLANWDRTQVTAGLVAGDAVVLSLDREGVQAGVAAMAEAEP
ncbi:efflux RND transporter periplasmic adaptor subunit [Thiohalocapsa marina]|uniref:Efflux RND transporter periplasmic adaptor subunit n=1 Tax=Thiohalocapsa marina TaxID=424902 RepID=A0A5M8FI72_9GAMM|nr:efflux RND transporter periplasmic adaptor subunit [Thiohalocapsa marina]KAA6184608.1 efflux RND transporter periplasmic adaptor subunit [Thiohalocapsa marina]